MTGFEICFECSLHKSVCTADQLQVVHVCSGQTCTDVTVAPDHTIGKVDIHWNTLGPQANPLLLMVSVAHGVCFVYHGLTRLVKSHR